MTGQGTPIADSARKNVGEPLRVRALHIIRFGVSCRRLDTGMAVMPGTERERSVEPSAMKVASCHRDLPMRSAEALRRGADNFLCRFKAARRAARAADSAARPSLPLRPAKTTPVGWREETREGAASTRGSHEAAAI